MIKKLSRYLTSLFLTVCLMANLTLVAFAVDASGYKLKFNGSEVAQIAVSGEADEIDNGTDNSYKIKASPYWGKRTRTLTFTNNHSGEIKITYSSLSDGTLTCNTGCEDKNNVITMSSGSSFEIAVTSGRVLSTTATFTYTNVWLEPQASDTLFSEPANGTFSITDADGNDVAIGNTAKTTACTLYNPVPDSGYKFFRWVFVDSSGAKTYISENTNHTYEISMAGTITCEFIPTGSAMYTVSSVKYAYFDEAITAAGTSKQIVVIESGTVYGSTGQTDFTIPNGVTLVLPYAAGQTLVQDSDMDGSLGGLIGVHFAYGNYGSTSDYYDQPGSLTATNVELTIPSGTIINNRGIIAVGGTLGGNAAMSGAHSNLKVDGTLNLTSNTSVLSAIGYIYGDGMVVANGSGAKILQPLSMLRSDSWGWSVSNVGQSMTTGWGMQTWPADGYNGGNPSPRYSTQAIQCDFQMACGDTMYGYVDQENSDTHYMGNIILVGSDSSSSLIALKSNATLKSTYDSSKTSSTYGNVGKLTLEINGGATQGTITLKQQLLTLSLSSWPFPVPYNYDLVLVDGVYDLQFDLSLLPGAGLTVGAGATLNVPSSVKLAAFTGAKDHSAFGVHTNPSTTSYNKGDPKSPRYPANSTLGAPSGGSMMANLVIDGGTLNVVGYLGGVVQTNGSGTIIMGSNTGSFTRQLGLTGESNDCDGDPWNMSGATIYKFYPQYFDEAGNLQTMESGKTYYAANSAMNEIESFTYDLYTYSEDVTQVIRVGIDEGYPAETINAKPVGQWYVPVAKIKDTEDNYLQDDGVAIVTSLTKALKILEENDKAHHVEMVAGSTVEVDVANALVDLNGQTVENVTVSEGAKFIDTGANGYGTDIGTLKVLDGGTNIPEYMTYQLGSTTSKYYVKVADGNTYTFPRVAVHVTGLQFALDTAENTGYLTFRGTFRGNSQAATKLSDVGFMFNNTDSVWFSKPDTENGESYSGSISSPVDKMHFYYTKPLKTINDITDAAALMKLADSDTPYPGKSVEVDTLLKQIKDAIAGSEYEQHQGLNDYFENLNVS